MNSYQLTPWVICLLLTLVDIYKSSSIYSSSHPLFLFIPPTRLHRTMFCCQATDRRVSPPFLLLPLFSASLPSALWLPCSILLPSPTEVSAPPTCTFQKKKEKKKRVLAWPCVPAHTVTCPDGLKRSGGAKQGEDGREVPGREGKLLNVAFSVTDL